MKKFVRFLTRPFVLGLILLAALAAFEAFNFSTTQYALGDILGEEKFAGVRWATILAIAFCGIDFAGLGRLFSPGAGAVVTVQRNDGLWYLMGAWFLAATLNAIGTWWAVTLSLLGHGFGNEVLSREELLVYAPIVVAVGVWLTRILIIGIFSFAGEKLFTAEPIAETQFRIEPTPETPARARRSPISVQHVAPLRR